MQILVNHLTRMGPGYICIAGLDLSTGRHIRPVGEDRLQASLASQNGGAFDLGGLVDLGGTKPRPSPPETEDHVFDPSAVTIVREPEPKDFWRELVQAAEPTLRAIFGEELHQEGRSAVVARGSGVRSLGVLAVEGDKKLWVKEWPGEPDKLRMRVRDGEFRLNLSVTDLRLVEDDHRTIRRKAVKGLQAKIRQEQVLLSVGLTRAWARPGEQPMHWLQVNNIFVASDPLGIGWAARR